jgi:hypothetical protein
MNGEVQNMTQSVAHDANPRTYSLRTLMLVVTWLAVCFRMASEGPLIGLFGMFMFSLAAWRTLRDCKLKAGGLAAMTMAQIVWGFFESAAVVIGAVFMGIALLLTMGIVALLLVHSKTTWLLGALGIGMAAAMFLLAPAVTFYYLASTWPRSPTRR